MTGLPLAVLASAAWTYLIVGRGGFWRSDVRETSGRGATQSQLWPRVTAIVPARDEAATIGACVDALLRQDYAGAFDVIVVDDHSTDATAQQARAAAAGAVRQLTVIAAPALDPGWTGKLWALNHGIRHAQSRVDAPEYLWFTDADIVHTADALRGLVGEAVDERRVLVSRMARLRCESLAERALVPAFIFFFQMLYPFAWINRTSGRTAAAAGGCMLVERQALQAAGGIAAVRGALIDDCALARRLRSQGAISLRLTEGSRSLRSYRTVGDFRRVVVRTAYAQLGYSPWLLAAAIAAMGVTFLVPPLCAIIGTGATRAMGASTWLVMALAYRPTLQFYGVSPLWGMALPAIAGAFLVFTVDSAWQSARGRNGLWKGRVYPDRGR